MKIKDTLLRLWDIRKYVNNVVLERESETDSSLMTLMAGESCLFIGDAGAAKTQHIHVLTEMMGLTLFDTLMSESTKPESIFGPIDVPALANGIQRTKISGYAPDSEVLFLDEIFKANNVVLNPLLWLLNEHKFRNGDDGVLECPTLAVFAASNEIPTDTASRPIYDRFLIRHEVGYIRSTNNMHKLFDIATGTHKTNKPAHLTKDDVLLLQKATKLVKVESEIWETMIKTRDQIKRATGVVVSDRRLAKSVSIVQAHALLHGRKRAEPGDIDVLSNIFWDTREQIRKVRNAVAAQSGFVKGDLLSYIETAESIYDKAIKTGGVGEALTKIKGILKVTKRFHTQTGRGIHNTVLDFGRKLQTMKKQRKDFQVIVMLDERDKEWLKLSEATSQLWTANQLRSVGFKSRRSLGYWWMPAHKKSTKKVLASRIEKKLKVIPQFHAIGEA